MSDPQIYVKGFGSSCRQGDLKQHFSKFGDIVEVRIIRDYAFIVKLESFRFIRTNRKLIRPQDKWMGKVSKVTGSESKSQEDHKGKKAHSRTISADTVAGSVIGKMIVHNTEKDAEEEEDRTAHPLHLPHLLQTVRDREEKEEKQRKLKNKAEKDLNLLKAAVLHTAAQVDHLQLKEKRSPIRKVKNDLMFLNNYLSPIMAF